MKQKTTYSRRAWLNPNSSPSTGSVVCYYGKTPFKEGADPYVFLEVSDCNNSIRLHNSRGDSIEDFKKKVTKLRDELNRYLQFLESA